MNNNMQGHKLDWCIFQASLETRATPEGRVNLVPPVYLASQAYQVLWELMELRVSSVRPVHAVPQDPQDQLVNAALRVGQEIEVLDV